MEDRIQKNNMMKELMKELVSDIADKGVSGAKAMKFSLENDDLEKKILTEMNLDSDLGSVADSLFEQINTLYKDFIKEYIEK